jgi:hypothetical protein
VVEKFVCRDSNITWTIAWAKVSNADVGVWFRLEPDELKIQDRSPGSGYQEGYPFGFVCEEGYIKPARELGMHPEEETVYERNLIYGKVPEVITRGHVTSPRRVELIEEPPPSECEALAKYLVVGNLGYFVKKVGAVENDGIIWEVVKFFNSSQQNLALGKGEKTNLVEDMTDAAANITAQVTTSSQKTGR